MAGPELALPAAPRREAEFGHDALVVCDNLVRIYQSETIEVQALQGLDLLVHEGELIALVGASGSGKSTLLNVLAGVDAPTAGRARVAGHDLLGMSRAERVHYRRHVVGFVRQQAALNLVPYLTRARSSTSRWRSPACRARERRSGRPSCWRLLGVAHCADRRPDRDVRWRAAAGLDRRRPRQPAAGCCWPTSRPASWTARPRPEVFAALRTVNQQLGATVVVVTHDAAVSGQVARTVAIRDGRTSSEVLRGVDGAEGGRACPRSTP